MNEQFLSEWGGLIIFIMLLINLFVYSFFNWRNFKNDLKSFTSLDVTVITAAVSLFFLRMVTIVNFRLWNIDTDWKVLLDLFKFADGRFAYTGLVLGLIVSTYFIFKSSNRLKSIRFLLDKIVISVAILSLVDMAILGGVTLAGFNVADPVSIISTGIVSLLTIVLSRINKIKLNSGFLSAVFIILVALGGIGVNITHSIILGSWQIEFESIVALVLIIYGIVELISTFPKQTSAEEEINENQMARKTRLEQFRSTASPLKYSQSYAKTDDILADLTVKERVVSKFNNLRRKSK